MGKHRRSARRIPPPGAHRLEIPWVRLRSGRGRPLVFQRMVGEVDPEAEAGDIVAVYDRDGVYVGQGFYHDESQIGLRMLSPDEALVDDSFFRERLRQAIEWRRRLVDDTTNTYRLIHAEGDQLSGLIAERYDDVIAIEVFSAGVARRLEMFRRLFGELTGIDRFVVRADEHIRKIEGFRIEQDTFGEVPDTVTVREHDLRFRVDLREGHKTGFFCDQRDNRYRLAQLCREADVLDVCCYTGGFGVYAKTLGGAKSVTGVDLDEAAVAMAKKNANLNNAKIQHVHADAFSYLRQMKHNDSRYDVVVLDPPKFIASRDGWDEGQRKYMDLNALGMDLVRPGGLLLTCSCSGMVSRDDFMDMIKSAAYRMRRSIQIVEIAGAAPDHPVMLSYPESAYLKAVWARVL